MTRFCSLIIVLFFPLCLVAQGLDTIRYHDERGGFVSYNDPGITMQAARFDLPAPGRIHAIAITLGGRSDKGSATLHLYGNEGGLPAPGVERDLIKPLRVKKTKAGLERIVVQLPNAPRITSHQLFVALEDFTPGVTLLSDRRTQRPACVSSSESFYYQLLRTGTERWTWGKFAFAVDIMMEYDRNASKALMADATREMNLPDSTLANHSIAWADINGDSYLDLLTGGRLFRNDRGETFTDITAASAIRGSPRANIFIDVNNDAAPDILFLGFADSTAGEGMLFINMGDGRFEQRHLSMPGVLNPTSISIADADGDGYLDLFIGQYSASDDRLFNHLLLNNRQFGFTDRSDLLHHEGRRLTGASRGSQWVDADGDGGLELFVANGGARADELWKKGSDGTYANLVSMGHIPALDGAEGGRIGCHWADYDGDGDMDLLLPRRVSVASVRTTGKNGAILMKGVAPPEQRYSSEDAVDIGYEEQLAGGAWGDANNDGRPDFILTTSCGCRYASLHIQKEEGGFEEQTHKFGLRRLAAGADAVWVDFDNDGLLDLATIAGERLLLLRNTLATTNKSLAIDLEGPHAIGATVDLYAGGRRITQAVTSGRGLLMQDPLRLHYGLDGAGIADSVIVRWAHGRTDRFTSLDGNIIHKLREGGSSFAAGSAERIDASPNPFTSVLQLDYQIQSAGPVRLAIHTADGALVRVLVDEKQSAGRYHRVWDSRNDGGEKVPQGTYIYRLSVGGKELSGKAVLVR